MVKRISKNKKSQKKRSQARKQNRKVSKTQSRRRSRRRSRKVSNKQKRSPKRSPKRSRKVVKKISKRQRRRRRRSRKQKQKQRGGSSAPTDSAAEALLKVEEEITAAEDKRKSLWIRKRDRGTSADKKKILTDEMMNLERGVLKTLKAKKVALEGALAAKQAEAEGDDDDEAAVTNMPIASRSVAKCFNIERDGTSVTVTPNDDD